MNQEQRILSTLRLIEGRIREKLTVEELAGSAYLSRYHYQRLFRQAVGETVMGYVARRRMDLAARDLAETAASVLDIALSLGYDSHEGFSRCFRAYIGMSPREYRRRFGKNKRKEKPAMKKSMEAKGTGRTMAGILEELRGLAAAARSTARQAREHRCPCPEAERFYSGLWEAAAKRSERSAEELDRALERIEAMGQGAGARAALLRALDETAFQAEATAFQIGVTMARANPAHRQAYQELEERFRRLAESSRLGAGKIAELMEELAEEIFAAMGEETRRLAAGTVEAGRSATKVIPKDPPYGYLSTGLEGICARLEGAAEEISPALAEDCLAALDVLDFSAQVDALRMPEHGALFAGIEGFRHRLRELREYLSGLPLAGEAGEPEVPSLPVFFLEAELQKLSPHLEESRRERLARLAGRIRRGESEAWDRLRREAGELGALGTVLLYICEKNSTSIVRKHSK